MANTKITLGDFELMQLILKAFDFECVTDATCVNKKVYRKKNVDVVLNRYHYDEQNM